MGTESIRCAVCGRFIPYRQMEDGTARFTFEPDSHKGPEISEWECAVCVKKYRPAAKGNTEDETV